MYSSYQSRLKKIGKALFGNQFKFSTHTWRKTGYLFASWADGEMSDIMKSARHTHLPTAQTYIKDANYLKSLATRNGLQTSNLLDKFLNIKCETRNTAHGILSYNIRAQ